MNRINPVSNSNQLLIEPIPFHSNSSQTMATDLETSRTGELIVAIIVSSGTRRSGLPLPFVLLF